MPFSFSKIGSTALRDAEVQQPKTAATRSLTSSFLDFSAKVGQSEAPSSLITLILRPSTPPIALIWSIASCSAWIDPVSEMAIVPVAEWSWPTVTSASVTASLVVFTLAVGNCWASAQAGRPASGMADRPCRMRRRREEKSFGSKVSIVGAPGSALAERLVARRNAFLLRCIMRTRLPARNTSIDVLHRQVAPRTLAGHRAGICAGTRLACPRAISPSRIEEGP